MSTPKTIQIIVQSPGSLAVHGPNALWPYHINNYFDGYFNGNIMFYKWSDLLTYNWLQGHKCRYVQNLIVNEHHLLLALEQHLSSI